MNSRGDDPRRPRADGEQNIDRKFHELAGKRGRPIVVAIRKPLLDDEILAFDVALFGETRPEKVEMTSLWTGAADLKPAEAVCHAGLLRLGRGRYGDEACAESEERERDPHTVPPFLVAGS
jgi:hypothetical protein